MSERMIELQRKKAGHPPINSINYNAPSSSSTIPVHTQSHGTNSIANVATTQRQAVVAATSATLGHSTSTHLPSAYNSMTDPIIRSNQTAATNVNVNTATTNISSTTTPSTHQRVYPISSSNPNARNGKKFNIPSATVTAAMSVPQQSPPLKAVDSSTLMLNEDERMRHFLALLSNSTNSTESGPTVPLSLSRRILNREGVNFMDESVPALMSVAADRFLATVLHQSKICHNRRLQGEETAKEEKKSLNRMKKRRREEKKMKRQKRLAQEKGLDVALKTPAGGSNGASDVTKGKKNSTRKVMTNSVTSKMITDVENALKDDNGNDSMDEEMEYYDNYLQGGRNKDSVISGGSDGTVKDKNDENRDDQSNDEDSDEDDDDEDDEDDDDDKLTLQLRDIVRPLEAWGVSLTGKAGISTPANHVEITKKNHETTDAEDDSNDDVDGDSDVEGEDDDDKSMSGASTSAASKQKGTEKARKRASTPKGPNLKSPIKTKQRKTSPAPQTGPVRSTTPSGSTKASQKQ